MGIAVSILLDNKASTGAGQVVEVDSEKTSFDVVITNIATVQIQASNNIMALTDPASVTWHTLATITTSGGYENYAPWRYWRANVSSYTSGTVTVRMGLTE
jgi:hypothetical protein